jgi:hypothetical protein
MLVFEAIIAIAIVALVFGGLFFVLVLDQSARRPRFNPMVWGCSLFVLGLVGVTIAWTTSALS